MKSILKPITEFLATLMVLPDFLFYQAGKAVCGAEKVFPGWSQAFSLVPGMLGVFLRRAFYRLVLPRCGADVCISFGTVVSHATAQFGRSVYIGPFCCLGDVTLEDDVLLGSGVSIMNGGKQHGTDRIDIPIREQPGTWIPITIGRDSWIGERAVVMADVGEHCVIGAGSVVMNPLPDYAVAAGMPARVLRYRQALRASEKNGILQIGRIPQ